MSMQMVCQNASLNRQERGQLAPDVRLRVIAIPRCASHLASQEGCVRPSVLRMLNVLRAPTVRFMHSLRHGGYVCPIVKLMMGVGKITYAQKIILGRSRPALD